MRKKQDSPQVGIRVKNIQSRRHQTIQHLQQSTISSQPFSLTLSNNFNSTQNEQPQNISESLSISLISQVQKLNQQIIEVASVIRLKQMHILQLEKKNKAQDIQYHKTLAELKSVIDMKNNEIKRRDEEISKKNEEIEKYRAELNIHIEDIRSQNKEMIVHLIKQLQRQRDTKQAYGIVQHERTLRSVEQNSFLQKQMQQNSFLQKQLEQTTIYGRQNSIKTSTENILSHSPSIKRMKIQKPQIPSESFKPLSQIVRMNTISDLQESIKMMSPLTLNIEELESKEKRKGKPKYIRKDELQNRYFQY